MDALVKVPFAVIDRNNNTHAVSCRIFCGHFSAHKAVNEPPSTAKRISYHFTPPVSRGSVQAEQTDTRSAVFLYNTGFPSLFPVFPFRRSIID
jgi:hypothetical protein